MTLAYSRTAAGIALTKDGLTTFKTGLLPAAGIPASQIVTTQTLTYPDLVKDNAYYYSQVINGSGPQHTDTAAAFITMVPQEWGPTASDPLGRYTNDLPDVLLGSVPWDVDFLDVEAVITRTTDPNTGHTNKGIMGDALTPIPKMGKSIRLRGGSCALEECYPLSRGFAVVRVLDIPSHTQKVYLRRYQSVSQPTMVVGFSGWSATNSPTDSFRYTYGSVKGAIVFYIGALRDAASGALQYQRGGSQQISLTDTTDFQSVYSADLTITPGYFDTDPALAAPSKETCIRLGSDYFDIASIIGSHTFATIPFGPADSSRFIIVALGTQTAGASPAVSSVTIGGVSATPIAASVLGSSGGAEFWGASVPSGTSGAVAVTYSSGNVRGGEMCAWALYHLASTTAVDTKTTTTSGGSVSLSTTAGGFAFGCHVHFEANANNTTRRMSGLASIGIQKFTQVSAGYCVEAGFQGTDGTALTIAQATAPTASECLCAVSFA